MGLRIASSAAAGIACAMLATAGCDPSQDAPTSTDDGPTFLTVVPAAVQPSSPDEGVAVVVQARGGTQIGIVTYGGKHRYAALGGSVESSCAELPGREPLYLLVKPDDRTCVLEARLFADCDPDDGGSAHEMCMANSVFVASTVVPISAALVNLGDGGGSWVTGDGAATADVGDAFEASSTDSAASAHDDGSPSDGARSDVAPEVPRGNDR